MNLFINLQNYRPEKLAAPRRRSRKVLRLEAESLECRTPLSSGLASALESIAVTRAAEIGVAIHATPAIILTTVRAEGSEQAVSTFESELDNASEVSAVAGSTLSVPASAAEDDPSNEPVVAELSPVIPPDAGRELPAIESLRATSDSVAEGGSVSRSVVAPSGTGGAIGELHFDGSTFGLGGNIEDITVPPMMGLSWGTMGRVSPPTSTDDDDSDMSYSGPLEPILATADPEDFSTPAPPTGRMLTPAFLGRSVQLESYGEYSSNSSGLSYLATGQGGAPLFQSAAGDDLLAWEESTSEPIPAGSITTGGLSLTNLLSGPDTSAFADSSRLEQVAELVPLPESSLALAATLWTIPSDSPPSTAGRHFQAEEAMTARARTDAMSSWMLFAAGVDQALERTCRELQDNIPATRATQHDDGSVNSPDELLEWQGPILPGAQRSLPESQTKVSETRRRQSDDAVGQGSTPARQAAQPTQGDGKAVVLAAMPAISVVSVFTAIATWIWRKRLQWPRLIHQRNAPAMDKLAS